MEGEFAAQLQPTEYRSNTLPILSKEFNNIEKALKEPETIKARRA